MCPRVFKAELCISFKPNLTHNEKILNGLHIELIFIEEINKDHLAIQLTKIIDLFDSNVELNKSANSKVDHLKSESISTQADIIRNKDVMGRWSKTE